MEQLGFSFQPDIERAHQADRGMQNALVESLRHVAERSRHAVAFDEDALERRLKAVEDGGRFSPGAFARYYQAVLATLDSEFDRARELIEAISASPDAADIPKTIAIDDPALGEEGALYLSLMNEDPSANVRLVAPQKEEAENFKTRLKEGRALMGECLPELAGEIDGIIHQIVITGSDKSLPMQFDGGSHFQLWGALFLNCAFHPDRVSIVEVLAHECAHSLLFGFCTEEALVLNDDEELFSSPLRRDARPMDGIYHATFVSARMHWAMTQLSRSKTLIEAERIQAQEAAEADVQNFNSGFEVVKKHGDLTKTGAALMDGAKRYMDANS